MRRCWRMTDDLPEPCDWLSGGFRCCSRHYRRDTPTVRRILVVCCRCTARSADAYVLVAGTVRCNMGSTVYRDSISRMKRACVLAVNARTMMVPCSLFFTCRSYTMLLAWIQDFCKCRAGAIRIAARQSSCDGQCRNAVNRAVFNAAHRRDQIYCWFWFALASVSGTCFLREPV